MTHIKTARISSNGQVKTLWLQITNQKLNLHYTGGITPKRVTSGGARLRGLAPGNTAPKKHGISRWLHCADMTGSGIELQTSRTNTV